MFRKVHLVKRDKDQASNRLSIKRPEYCIRQLSKIKIGQFLDADIHKLGTHNSIFFSHQTREQ